MLLEFAEDRVALDILDNTPDEQADFFFFARTVINDHVLGDVILDMVL